MLALATVAGAAVTVTRAAERSATPWNPRWYQAPRAATAPVIDGRLDDLAWQAVPPTADFVDIEGVARPVAPRFATRARITWDDRALYVAAELEEPHVWATLTRRDTVIFWDNDFEVFLDPDGDHHLYGELEINALGTEWDLLLVRPYRDGGPAIDGWDIAGLETAVHVDGTLNDASDVDRGWTVEIALPWDALAEIAGGMACPPEPGDTWRLNLSRVQWEHDLVGGRYVRRPVEGRGWKGEDNWVWSPQGAVAMHLPERWGFVTFVDGAGAAAGEVAGEVADPREAVREVYELLMPVFHAQRDYRRERGRYATRLADLAALPAAVRGRLTSLPRDRFSLDAAGDHAFAATLRTDDGAEWTIDHAGRLSH
jgi:hypothetical protein